MTSEPRLGLPVRLKLDRSGVQSEVIGKTGTSSKPECSVLTDFSFRRRRALATEIGPTSTQAASGRGKARTVASLGGSGGGDE
jgi:hypothetical protein